MKRYLALGGAVVLLSGGTGFVGGYVAASQQGTKLMAGRPGPPGPDGPVGPPGPQGPQGPPGSIAGTSNGTATPTASTPTDPISQCMNDPAVRANAQAASVAVTGRSITAAALRALCVQGMTTAVAAKSWFIQRDIDGTLKNYGY